MFYLNKYSPQTESVRGKHWGNKEYLNATWVPSTANVKHNLPSMTLWYKCLTPSE